MKHLFYFLLIIPFLIELLTFVNLKKVHAFVLTFKGAGKNLDPNQIVFGVLQWFYLIWIFIGLFSFQWPVFLIVLILGLIKKSKMWWRAIDSFICTVLLMFVLLNAYHFNIDVYDYIVNFFQTL
jgi:hypothetical protein